MVIKFYISFTFLLVILTSCQVQHGESSNLMQKNISLSPQKRPNIIFFLADDMGMGDTSVYQKWSGNSDDIQLHTPAMQMLANRGIVFTDAHSPSSRCTPSRYAFMTGRYCWRTHLKQEVLKALKQIL